MKVDENGSFWCFHAVETVPNGTSCILLFIAARLPVTSLRIEYPSPQNGVPMTGSISNRSDYRSSASRHSRCRGIIYHAHRRNASSSRKSPQKFDPPSGSIGITSGQLPQIYRTIHRSTWIKSIVIRTASSGHLSSKVRVRFMEIRLPIPGVTKVITSGVARSPPDMPHLLRAVGDFNSCAGCARITKGSAR